MILKYQIAPICLLFMTISCSQLFAQTPALAKTTYKVTHGTLIMITPTIGGLIVCADKRGTNSKNDAKFSDSELKIRPLGKKAFYAVTGYSSMEWQDTSGNGNKFVFNINSIIVEYFSGKDTNDMKALLFSDNSKSAFLPFVLSKLSSEILGNLEATHNRNDVLVQIIFCYLDQKNIPKGIIFKIFYNTFSADVKKPHPVDVSAGIEDTNDNFFRNSDPLEYGMTDLIKVIRLRTNEKINDILLDQDKEFFFGKGLKPRNTALAFTRKMIWLSSQKKYMNNQETGVSPICDCAILDYKKGFSWLGKNLRPDFTK